MRAHQTTPFTETQLQAIISAILPADPAVMSAARMRIDGLLKPVGSLGKLEKIAVRIAGITGKVYNQLSKKCILIFCADNGICEEGVSSAPVAVTAVMTGNFLSGGTGVTVLAALAGASLVVVDMGIATDLDIPGLIVAKQRKGTNNFAKGPAMSREDVLHAIGTGYHTALEQVKDGALLLGTGEMGIGNTSTSAAVLQVLSGIPLEEVAGRGAGISDEQLTKKLAAIQKGLTTNRPNKQDVLDVLAKVGGLDIAALTGAYIGAAAARVPIVLDGFISSVAALCAYRLCPSARDAMIPSHLSEEPGAQYVTRELGLEPMLNMNMRLGEGSGAALAFPIIDAALAMVSHMKTFEEGLVVEEDYVDKWESSDDRLI